MEKAIITLINERNEKIDSMTVQFNPSEFSIDSSASFAEDGHIGSTNDEGKKKSQFLAEQRSSMKVKLTFDGFTETGTLDEEKAANVNKYIDLLRRLVKIDEELHRPPLCLFEWGTSSFMGYAEQINVQYTMFSSKGIPIRATVDLSIKSGENKRYALQSPDRTKRHIVTQGMPLYMVAYEAYDDPAEWRPIAGTNGIKNPRKLRTGSILRIPPLEPEPL